jgi:hypothetical protein
MTQLIVRLSLVMMAETISETLIQEDRYKSLLTADILDLAFIVIVLAHAVA